MKVVGKRSNDLLIGALIGLIIIAASVAGMVIIKQNNTYLFVPVVIGMIIVAYYSLQYFSIPHDIVYLNEDDMELTVFINNKNSVCFKISSITNMFQNPSGFRRKSTAHIYISYIDDSAEDTNVLNRARANKEVVCKYISRADSLTELISNIKKNENSKKLEAFEKQ